MIFTTKYTVRDIYGRPNIALMKFWGYEWDNINKEWVYRTNPNVRYERRNNGTNTETTAGFGNCNR